MLYFLWMCTSSRHPKRHVCTSDHAVVTCINKTVFICRDVIQSSGWWWTAALQALCSCYIRIINLPRLLYHGAFFCVAGRVHIPWIQAPPCCPFLSQMMESCNEGHCREDPWPGAFLPGKALTDVPLISWTLMSPLLQKYPSYSSHSADTWVPRQSALSFWKKEWKKAIMWLNFFLFDFRKSH